jgi:hypothetical protein
MTSGCMAAACGCGMQVDSDSDFAFLHLISEFPTHEPECQSGFKFARPSLPGSGAASEGNTPHASVSGWHHWHTVTGNRELASAPGGEADPAERSVGRGSLSTVARG